MPSQTSTISPESTAQRPLPLSQDPMHTYAVPEEDEMLRLRGGCGVSVRMQTHRSSSAIVRRVPAQADLVTPCTPYCTRAQTDSPSSTLRYHPRSIRDPVLLRTTVWLRRPVEGRTTDN